MIELDIPQDIKDYEPKFIGPLTLRKAICVGLCAITDVLSFNVLKGFCPDSSVKVIVPLIFTFIFFLFGWGKMLFGMNFENYLILQFSTVHGPRLYKIENKYEKLEKECKKQELKEAKQNKNNKNNNNIKKVEE